MKNIKEYGAIGNGLKDDFPAINKALENESELLFPKGRYVISQTLYIPSDRKLVFEEGAVLKLRSKKKCRRGDFLLSNKNTKDGDKNIEINGATFDGNNGFFKHKRSLDIFKKDGYSGILINFCNVKNLILRDITLENPVAYFMRFCKIDGFLIEDIELKSKKVMPNQDGIHFAGEVRNGTVRNVRATTYGQTNDDLLALNADDYMGRVEEFDTVCGTIENVLFENIYADNCHDGVRLLSYTSAIRNIQFRNLNIGARGYVVECNAARGCRAELFKEEDEPSGVGKIENVSFTDCTFWHAKDELLFWTGTRLSKPHPLVLWGSLADKAVFKNCRFIDMPLLSSGLLQTYKNTKKRKKYNKSDYPAFLAKNITNEEICFDGKIEKIIKKEDSLTIPVFTDLSIKSTK